MVSPVAAAERRRPDALQPKIVKAGRPDAAAYASAAWPDHTPRERLSASNFQGKSLPVPFGSEKWLTEKPETPLNERVLVLDFWATWCRPCIAASPKLAKLQKEHKDDLMVIAVGGSEPEKAVRDYLDEHGAKYHHTFDGERKVSRALGVQGIPHVVILSTDGMIRWQGNPLADPEFNDVVKQIVAADPGVQARREAEKAASQS